MAFSDRGAEWLGTTADATELWIAFAPTVATILTTPANQVAVSWRTDRQRNARPIDQSRAGAALPTRQKERCDKSAVKRMFQFRRHAL